MEPKEEKPYQEKKLSRSEAYFRKKKKKSFLQNAKGFGKKESFGRGCVVVFYNEIRFMTQYT